MVTDPDGPSRPDQINFNGNETIVIGGLTFPASSYQGVKSSVDTISGHTLTWSEWSLSSAANTDKFQVLQLKGALGTDGKLSDSAAGTQYVRAAVQTETSTQMGPGASGPVSGFTNDTVFGLQTAAGDMAHLGTAHFGGEADFNGALGRLSVDVDFGASANPLSGRLDFAGGADAVISFSANISGSEFTGPASGLNFDHRDTGTVAGAFYGPTAAAAAEVGGVIDLNGGTGAFVGGRSAAPALAPLALQGPYATYGAAGTASAALPAGPGLVVTITEPDTLSPTDLTQINFNGNETIRVQAPGYDHTFVPTDAYGRRSTFFFSGPSVNSVAANINASNWVSGDSTGGNQFVLYQLPIGAPVTSGVQPTSRYAMVTEWGSATPTAGVRYGQDIYTPTNGGFQVIGVPSAASDLPLSGTATFQGQAIGRYLTGSGTANGTLFLAPTTLAVDFSRTAGSITGSITNPAYYVPSLVNPSAAPFGPAFAISFTADRSGAGFTSASATATGGVAATGQVQGSFYGPGAAEAGGVFSLQGTGQALVGGFVAGR